MTGKESLALLSEADYEQVALVMATLGSLHLLDAAVSVLHIFPLRTSKQHYAVGGCPSDLMAMELDSEEGSLQMLPSHKSLCLVRYKIKIL